MDSIPRAAPSPISTQSTSAHLEERAIKSSGDPWNKIVSDLFQQKTIKVLLIDPFKFARERLNVRRVWLEIGFFPINIEVNTPS